MSKRGRKFRPPTEPTNGSRSFSAVVGVFSAAPAAPERRFFADFPFGEQLLRFLVAVSIFSAHKYRIRRRREEVVHFNDDERDEENVDNRRVPLFDRLLCSPEEIEEKKRRRRKKWRKMVAWRKDTQERVSSGRTRRRRMVVGGKYKECAKQFSIMLRGEK